MIVISTDMAGITVEGHAGYAPKGYDIVCAAISVLFQSLGESIKELTEDDIHVKKADGYMRIDYKDLSEQGKLLIDSFFIGINGVAEAYPEYLIIKSPHGR